MPKLNQTPTIDRILQLLYDFGPMSKKEIAHYLGRSVESVSATLWEAHKQKRWLHVSRWEKNQKGKPSPVFDVGNEKDACKHATPSAKERQAKFREANRIKLRMKCKARRAIEKEKLKNHLTNVKN